MKNGEPHKLFFDEARCGRFDGKIYLSNPPKEKELESLRAEIAFALIRPLKKTKNTTWQFFDRNFRDNS